MSDPIEQEIQDKGLTAPRITPAQLQENISSVHYFTADDGQYGALAKQCDSEKLVSDVSQPYVPSLDLLTFCVIVLKNGFTVTGESACASPENFDVEVGRKIARQNAEQKIWPLMGYALKQKLADPYRCRGTNCSVSFGEHSEECLDEASKAQGWAK